STLKPQKKVVICVPSAAGSPPAVTCCFHVELVRRQYWCDRQISEIWLRATSGIPRLLCFLKPTSELTPTLQRKSAQPSKKPAPAIAHRPIQPLQSCAARLLRVSAPSTE